MFDFVLVLANDLVMTFDEFSKKCDIDIKTIKFFTRSDIQNILDKKEVKFICLYNIEKNIRFLFNVNSLEHNLIVFQNRIAFYFNIHVPYFEFEKIQQIEDNMKFVYIGIDLHEGEICEIDFKIEVI